MLHCAASKFCSTSSDYDVAYISYYDPATAGIPGLATISASWTADSWWNESYRCDWIPVEVVREAYIQVSPKITSISPPRGYPGQVLDVEINGSGFGNTAEDVSIEAGGNIVVRSIQEISNTKIKVRFSIAANASTGNQYVTVTVAGFDSNSKEFFSFTPRLQLKLDERNCLLK